MLAFYNPASPELTGKAVFNLVHFYLLIVCKAGLSAAAATPDPSAPDSFHLANDADTTPNFNLITE